MSRRPSVPADERAQSAPGFGRAALSAVTTPSSADRPPLLCWNQSLCRRPGASRDKRGQRREASGVPRHQTREIPRMDASAPIPPALDDDDEDVYLALSTAGTLWSRGEHEDALRWLRRAAETASDVDADARSLELFKAAAEVTSIIKALANASKLASERASAPPPEPAAPPKKAAPPPLPPRNAPQQQQPAQVVSVSPQLPGGRRATRGAAARMQAVPQVASARPPVVVPPPAAHASQPPAVPSRPGVKPRIPEPAPSASRQPSTPVARANVPAPYDMQARPSSIPMPPATARSAAPTSQEAARGLSSSQPSGGRAGGGRAAAPGGQTQGRTRTRSRVGSSDDDVTAPRDLPDLVGTPDDLDEETNIIEGEEHETGELGAILRGGAPQRANVEPPARKEPAAAAPAPSPASTAVPAPKASQPAPSVARAAEKSDQGFNEVEDPTRERAIPSASAAAPAPVVIPSPAAASVAGPALAGASAPTPAAVAAPSPAPAAAPIAAPVSVSAPTVGVPSMAATSSALITSIRVAVVVTTTLELRLVALGQGEPSPPGAAVATLVPSTDADGLAIAKLLGVAR